MIDDINPESVDVKSIEDSTSCSKVHLLTDIDLENGEYFVEVNLISDTSISKHYRAVTFEVVHINNTWYIFMLGVRYVMFVISLAASILFWCNIRAYRSSELSFEQRWLRVICWALVFYNGPFSIFTYFIPNVVTYFIVLTLRMAITAFSGPPFTFSIFFFILVMLGRVNIEGYEKITTQKYLRRYFAAGVSF